MNFKSLIEENEMFQLVAEVAKERREQAFIIGGYVRDLLLKRPSKDVDFVVLGKGIEFAQAVGAKVDPKTRVNYFKNFGTAMINTGDFEYEFVGARKESYRRESRKPIVEEGTLGDDQNRRDFTINALAISLNQETLGDLVDPFGGITDMDKKIIKTPLEPSKTFSDDPLRMMRAIRFASQLNFDIDPLTFQGIEDNASRIEIVSKERIADELNKIVLSPIPSYGFKLLFQSGLLELIFPEMVELHGVEYIDGKGHKDNFYHTLKVLDNVAEKSDDLWLRWAAIMHDIAKPRTKRFSKKVGWTFHGHEDRGARMVQGIFRTLKLPLDHKMKYVQKLVRLHLRPIALVKDIVTDSAIRRLLVDAGTDVEDLMTLCRADITSKDHNRVQRYLNNFDKVEAKMKAVIEKDDLRNFQLPITGEDIMTAFDIKPSKVVGDIKEEIKEAIITGVIPNERESALQLMKEVGGRLI